MSKLLDQFNKEYDFLYEHDNVAGEREAVAWFDDKLKNDEAIKQLVAELGQERHDFISSDREAAAFAFACEVLDIG